MNTKKKPTLEQVGKAAPHLFFVKHGGKPVKNPHYSALYWYAMVTCPHWLYLPHATVCVWNK